MKNNYLVFIGIVFFFSCTTDTGFPFDSYDYSTNQITLGISFPPVSDAQQYQITFDSMSELNMDCLRLDLHWDSIESTQNTRVWTSLGTRLDTITSKGHKVFLTIDLKSFPAWFDSLSEMDQINAFEEFIIDLLFHFKDKISFLQFGNEWNWEVEDHFGDNLTQFIALGNIVYNKTVAVSSPRPEVVLASLSTAGLSALAIAQDKMENVYFNGSPLYTQAEIDSFDKPGYLSKVNQVLQGISFESIDLHFYADYWNWGIYMNALNQALTAAGKPTTFPIIASEFGGAHPIKESLDQETQADRIVSYVHTLDNLGVREAYFFKLVENPAHDTEFWNSYLIAYNGLKKTLGYEVLRRFGAASLP